MSDAVTLEKTTVRSVTDSYTVYAVAIVYRSNVVRERVACVHRMFDVSGIRPLDDDEAVARAEKLTADQWDGAGQPRRAEFDRIMTNVCLYTVQPAR